MSFQKDLDLVLLNYNSSMYRYFLCLILLFSWTQAALALSSVAQVETELREPQNPDRGLEQQPAATENPESPTNVSDFAASPFKLGSQTAQIPTRTRLRMLVETAISAETAQIGDSFKAKVTEDYYLEGDYRKIIIPKNSWIRGKVSVVKRPRLLSRSGKLAIKLDSLVTPTGDYVALDADLSFVPGVVNFEGLLDPQTDFGDKALSPTQKLLSSEKGRVISVATAGLPIAGSLLAGSVVALFSHGDAASVAKGQELQIIITKDTDLGF